jgi:predicted DNA-binding ribbon-helix-helix protein
VNAQAVRKRSVTLAGHRTSLSLEEAFWDALKDAAREEKTSINALVERIDRERTGNLSSAVRVFLLARARSGR